MRRSVNLVPFGLALALVMFAALATSQGGRSSDVPLRRSATATETIANPLAVRTEQPGIPLNAPAGDDSIDETRHEPVVQGEADTVALAGALAGLNEVFHPDYHPAGLVRSRVRYENSGGDPVLRDVISFEYHSEKLGQTLSVTQSQNRHEPEANEVFVSQNELAETRMLTIGDYQGYQKAIQSPAGTDAALISMVTSGARLEVFSQGLPLVVVQTFVASMFDCGSSVCVTQVGPIIKPGASNPPQASPAPTSQ